MSKENFSENIRKMPILKDFHTFVKGLEEAGTHITNTGKLPPKLCFALNEKMFYKKNVSDPRTHHHRYPLLYLFFHVAIDAQLFTYQEKAGKTVVVPIKERLSQYHKLNDLEKYFFLLQTMWMENDWSIIAGKEGNRSNAVEVHEALEIISNLEADQEYDNYKPIRYLQNDLFFFNEYFIFFGWWETAFTQGDGNTYIARKFTPTKLGVHLSKKLIVNRPVAYWNKINATFPIFSFVSEEEARKNDPKPEDLPDDNLFIDTFKKEFPDVKQSLELPKVKPRDGKFIFKVSVETKVWRKIQTSGQHTLDELHLAIQDAFNFDNEHLYSFFMDGKRWSEQAFNSPYGEEQPFADEVKIKDLNLKERSRFLYLFDYGDEWLFYVTLEKFIEDPSEDMAIELIDSQGESPKQYGGWEEEEVAEEAEEEDADGEEQDQMQDQAVDDDEWN